MIEYHFEYPLELEDLESMDTWIEKVVRSEDQSIDEIVYVFVDDEHIWELNKKFLNHDTYTDILTFPYDRSNGIKADIFISVPRILENSMTLGLDKAEELRRVMIHGILHLLGYEDHTEEERELMRKKEEEKLEMFHVEQ